MDHQAFAQLLGNYGEFVGAIAVVGTLVYLAVQIRQSKDALDANTRSLDENRNLTKADTIRQLTQRWDDITYRVSESREAASIFVRGNSSLGDLDAVDQLIYTTQLAPFLTHHLTAIQLSEAGFLDQQFVEFIDETVGDMLRRHPGARTWWEAAQHGFPHREYVNALIDRDDEGGGTFGSPIVPAVQGQ
jgi:hypothetical protein